MHYNQGNPKENMAIVPAKEENLLGTFENLILKILNMTCTCLLHLKSTASLSNLSHVPPWRREESKMP